MRVRSISAAVIAVVAVAAASSVSSQGERPASPRAAPAVSPVTDALSALSKDRRNAPVRGRAGYTWRVGPGRTPLAAIWVAGEFDAGVATHDDQWENGADVFLEVTATGGSPVDVAHQTLTRDSRSFVVRLPAGGGVGPGEYDVRFTAKASGGSLGSTETLHVMVPKVAAGEEPLVGQPMVFRRGPFTGLAWVPAGDLRFRRQEHVKVETAVVGAAASATIRLLDRTGSALPLPVASSEHDEGGCRIVSGEVTLAPLSAGDYLLETTVTSGATTCRALAAFRIVP